MAERLAHRGPDDTDVWVDPAGLVALAHRRLAIFDLSPLARQPMASPSGRYVLIFNGAIYNFPELKRILEQSGYAFRSASDTEVLAAAFDAWGPEDTLTRLVGMFAIAAWDIQKRTLMMARDRAGQKPLVYGVIGAAFVFASEVKSFFAVPGFERKLDRRAIDLYTRLANVPAPHCIFQGMHKLPPGHVVEIGWDPATWSRITTRIFWRRADYSPRPAMAYAEARIEAERLLSAAVTSQMISDVPLGAFLSGGFDSTAVVAFMQARASRPVKTFSVGFTDPAYDESGFARTVARHLGTDHTDIRLEPSDAMAVIADLPGIYDEPFADPSQIPTTLLARLARRHVTVALSGDGGDEVFGGYTRHVFGPWLWRGARWGSASLRRMLAGALRAPPLAAWSSIARAAGRPQVADQIEKVARALPAASADDLYDRLIACWLDPPLRTPEETTAFRAQPLARGEDVADNFMVRDFIGYLPDDILVKVDRATMSVGLEGRTPFLDHRLVEFMATVPSSFKIDGGTSKRLLRDIVFSRVPPTMMDRPKSGFDVPVAAWLRGPLKQWAGDVLTAGAAAHDGIFDPAIISAAWTGHQSGTVNRHHELWCILMFYAWARHYNVTV